MILINKEIEANAEKIATTCFGYTKKVLANDPFILYDLITKTARPTTKQEKEFFGIVKSGVLHRFS